MDGFVQIHPTVEIEATCPFTGRQLAGADWAVPGMWTLAKLHAPGAPTGVWTDIPFGPGLLAPCFVNEATGEVVRPLGHRWYTDVTRAAWHAQTDTAVSIRVVRRRTAKRACLINCLNPYWGDAVSLLVRTNQLRAHPDLDIVVLVTSNLEWLVPDFVAEAWIVEDTLASTAAWNNGLLRQVKTLVSGTDACYVPSLFQPAEVSSGDLVEFSRTPQFPRAEWDQRLRRRPAVTFVWRPDRCWSRDAEPGGIMDSKLARSRPLRRAADRYKRVRALRSLRDQSRRVRILAARLREQIPSIDFAVMGHGEGPSLGAGITDLRRDRIDVETERAWCRRAAESHVVVGVHGSHMVLPSGHAGATIELLPHGRTGNVLQDLLVSSDDPREALYCYRVVPLNASPAVIGDMILNILYNYSWVHFALHHKYTGPLSAADYEAIRTSQTDRADVLHAIVPDGQPRFMGP